MADPKAFLDSAARSARREVLREIFQRGAPPTLVSLAAPADGAGAPGDPATQAPQRAGFDDGALLRLPVLAPASSGTSARSDRDGARAGPAGDEGLAFWVSDGLSQPWRADATTGSTDERFSGLGVEFVLMGAERSRVLPALLWGLCRAVGSGALELPLAGDWVRARDLVDDCGLDWLFFHEQAGYRHRAQLPSGHVALLHVVGCTEGELERGVAVGGNALREALAAVDAHRVTVPGRASWHDDPRFVAALARERALALAEADSGPAADRSVDAPPHAPDDAPDDADDDADDDEE